jgi:hypothetical protein
MGGAQNHPDRGDLLGMGIGADRDGIIKAGAVIRPLQAVLGVGRARIAKRGTIGMVMETVSVGVAAAA